MSFKIDHPCLKTHTFQNLKVNLQPWIFYDTLQAGQTMTCNNNYLADILVVCEIKDLIWVMLLTKSLSICWKASC